MQRRTPRALRPLRLLLWPWWRPWCLSDSESAVVLLAQRLRAAQCQRLQLLYSRRRPSSRCRWRMSLLAHDRWRSSTHHGSRAHRPFGAHHLPPSSVSWRLRRRRRRRRRSCGWWCAPCCCRLHAHTRHRRGPEPAVLLHVTPVVTAVTASDVRASKTRGRATCATNSGQLHAAWKLFGAAAPHLKAPRRIRGASSVCAGVHACCAARHEVLRQLAAVIVHCASAPPAAADAHGCMHSTLSACRSAPTVRRRNSQAA